MIKSFLTFRTLSIVLAILLAITAALKLHLLLTDPFADLTLGFPRWLVWLGIGVEFSVMLIAMRSKNSVLAWNILLSLFSVFLLISSFQIMMGVESCGCFGRASFSPFATAAFDLIVIATLIVLRRSLRNHKDQADISNWNPGVQQLAQIAATISIFGVLSVGDSNFARMLFQRFQGESVFCRPVHVENLIVGELANAVTQITNTSDRPQEIVGARKSCGCVSIDAVGLEIPSKSSSILKLAIRPVKAGAFRQRVVYYLKDPKQTSVFFDIYGHVKERNAL